LVSWNCRRPIKDGSKWGWQISLSAIPRAIIRLISSKWTSGHFGWEFLIGALRKIMGYDFAIYITTIKLSSFIAHEFQ
jgi:hypothetical protein